MLQEAKAHTGPRHRHPAPRCAFAAARLSPNQSRPHSLTLGDRWQESAQIGENNGKPLTPQHPSLFRKEVAIARLFG